MNANTSLTTTLHFTPYLDTVWIALIAVIGLGLLVASAFIYRRGLMLRVIAYIAFTLALLNPSLLREERNYVKDVAVIVVDRSTSQTMQQRTQTTNNVLEYLKSEINDSGQFELRVIEAPKNALLTNRTDLFDALDQSLSDVPKKRRAGVIFITDGQVHDVPKIADEFDAYGPVHVILSGKKNEKDRQIVIENAPAYGLVGKNITIKYKVDDTRNIGASNAEVTLTLHNGEQRTYYVPVNKTQSVSVPLDHAGQNVFSIEVEAVKDEISKANNKTAVIANGVRDRLKVLLVSGVPHAGERTWRNLLTGDPGVDLVHFTILREPQKFDYTPKNQLSLIAFPFQELFERKLYDFDLIIFDRYSVNNILPERYFQNITEYVQKGGAFLVSSGPSFATNRSVYDTPLGQILPARPTGTVNENKYVPKVTPLGHQHPVTKNLIWNNDVMSDDKDPTWGAWLRYIDITPLRGDVLMSAMNDKPLLILDRVGQGRVAQLSSDQIWLWSRGYNGGGPHAELLRRIVHWLMKEPELDERAMHVSVNKNVITIQKSAYGVQEEAVSMRDPEGDMEVITLKQNNKGVLEYKYNAQHLGIHAFEDTLGTRKFAVVGDLNPPELRGIKTSEEKLSPLVEASRGTFIWASEEPTPKITSYASTRKYGGSDWLALKRNDDYTVSGIRDIPLLPEWVIFLILMSILIGVWWKEGQTD